MLGDDPKTVFQEGIDLFNACEFYDCHEYLEEVWTPTNQPDRWFLQSLIHFAVGFYHHQQGNKVGTIRQLGKGLKKIQSYLPEWDGVATAEIERQVRARLALAEADTPFDDYPQIRQTGAWPGLRAPTRNQKSEDQALYNGGLMSKDYLHGLFGLDGQVAVVIGGTGVLGGAICDGIAQAGAHVVVAGRSQERGETRAKAVADLGGSAEFVAVDVTSRESITALKETVVAKCGRADMLVNCAGVNSAVPYEEISDDDWEKVIDTNLKATHLGCQIFAPAMADQENGGSILNIGSVTAHLPLSRVFAYSASKAAVNNLTKNVAREYATKGVRVNSLNPGFFPAEQNRKILQPERVQKIMDQTPMARFGEPPELVGGRAASTLSKRREFCHRHRGLRRRRLHRNAFLGQPTEPRYSWSG